MNRRGRAGDRWGILPARISYYLSPPLLLKTASAVQCMRRCRSIYRAMKKTKETTLFRFVKDECANFNKYYGICLSDSPCLVMNGKRCGFFERNVLGPADNKFRLPGYDYQKLFAQYADQTGAKTQRIKIRLCPCGCGTSLLPRQRMCDDEKEKRRKASYRKNKNSKRLTFHS